VLWGVHTAGGELVGEELVSGVMSVWGFSEGVIPCRKQKQNMIQSFQ